MAKLNIEEEIWYLVDGRKLEPDMAIRRYDEIAGLWFEGKVRRISGYDHEEQRISVLALAVDGYVPSPLQEGDTVEIVGEAE